MKEANEQPVLKESNNQDLLSSIRNGNIKLKPVDFTNKKDEKKINTNDFDFKTHLGELRKHLQDSSDEGDDFYRENSHFC